MYHTSFSHSIFNDQPRTTLDCSKNYPFFQQNKKITHKHRIINQPCYSEDEKYYPQNQQRFNKNKQNKKWNIDQPDPTYQPDLFEPYTRKEQTRRTRQNPASYIIITFVHKTLQIHKNINQPKCKKKSHNHIIYNNMK